MQIIYTLQELPKSNTAEKMVFLAGPTPRSKRVKSWRPEALGWFVKYDYKGIVFFPEPQDKSWDHLIKDDVIKWELDACALSNAIMFWIPRKMKTMPGLTTNVEFGYWINSKRIIYGRPNDADSIVYLDYLYGEKFGEYPYDNLEKLVERCCLQVLL